MSDGVILSGQQFDEQLGLVKQYTEQVKDYDKASPQVTGSEGVAATEIIPVDGAAAKVRTWNTTAIGVALDAIVDSYPVKIDIPNLPPTITALTAVFSKEHSNGAADETAVSGSAGDDFSYSVSANANAQGSAGVVADIYPTVVETNGQNKDALEYLFFMARNFTHAQLLTRLTTLHGSTVLAWPKFKPQSISIIATGTKITEAKGGKYSESARRTPSTLYVASSSGKSKSGDVSIVTKDIQIPASLHALLTLPSGTTEAFTLTAVATHGASDYASSASPTNASGSFSGGGLAATSPASIPTTGKHLFRIDVVKAAYERNLVRAIVFDFADLL